MIKFRILIVLITLVLLLQSVPQTGAQTQSLWVAFRYAPNEVISYVGRLTDPIKISMNDVKDGPYPITPDSSCGYTLPITPERLRTFSPHPESVPAIGRKLTLLTGGNARITVAVDRYVETWHGDPEVSVGVIAKVSPKDLAKFKNVSSSYFLMSTATQPAVPGLDGRELSFPAKRATLNRFGAMGDLIELRGELGWDIRLYRMSEGKMQPTAISFACGD